MKLKMIKKYYSTDIKIICFSLKQIFFLIAFCLANYSFSQGTTCATATSITVNGTCATNDNIADGTQSNPLIGTSCGAANFRREGWYTFTITGGPSNVIITGVSTNRNLFLQLIFKYKSFYNWISFLVLVFVEHSKKNI